ncbi:hypothetical protein ACFYYS_21165 [Streptomyces sp. NPDC002120]
MIRMRIAQAAAVLTLTVVAPLLAAATATAATPDRSAPIVTVQDNMGWQ